VGTRPAQLALVVGAGEDVEDVLERDQLQIVPFDAGGGDRADRTSGHLTLTPRVTDHRQ
jgi:hypothetical protein